jgi:hypothetical protein
MNAKHFILKSHKPHQASKSIKIYLLKEKKICPKTEKL